jgi:tRNA (guanine-N7-)-methyltransferase
MRLDWPTDFSALFGRLAPLVVELGFGGGHFLMSLAHTKPEANILGIEMSTYSLWETERKIILERLPHVHVVQLDARTALGYLFGPAVIDELYINFPDPFPKNGHIGRRLLNGTTLHQIAWCLKPGARLTIATDVPAYAESIAADLAATPGLVNLHGKPFVRDVPGRTRTRYEQKALDKGVISNYFEWVRTDAPITPPDVPPQPDPGRIGADGATMPNIVLTSPLTPRQIAAQFTPMMRDEGPIHVRYIAMYEHTHEAGLLIDSFIDEPLIEQRPAIAIAAPEGLGPGGEPTRYVIRLANIGYPRPTAGAHIAVRKLAEWLLRLDSATVIIHDNAH